MRKLSAIYNEYTVYKNGIYFVVGSTQKAVPIVHITVIFNIDV